jgi:hypothetical protein
VPKFVITDKEWELLQELMFHGSDRIAWGTVEWKAYNDLRVKMTSQV